MYILCWGRIKPKEEEHEAKTNKNNCIFAPEDTLGFAYERSISKNLIFCSFDNAKFMKYKIEPMESEVKYLGGLFVDEKVIERAKTSFHNIFY